MPFSNRNQTETKPLELLVRPRRATWANSGDATWASGALAPLAIKQMSKKHVVAKAQLAHVHDERRLLAKVSHPNVVRYFGAFQDERSVYLVTELVEGPDLWSLVYEPRSVGFSINSKLCDAPDDLLRFYVACVATASATWAAGWRVAILLAAKREDGGTKRDCGAAVVHLL